METSALQSINIEKAFRQMIEEIYNKNHKNLEEDDDDMEFDFSHKKNVDLSVTPLKEEKKCCN
jgi:hypothetical protein